MDEDWWEFGDYVPGECPNCQRERLLSAVDPQGKTRVVCEKCGWEPAAGRYRSETDQIPQATVDISGLR